MEDKNNNMIRLVGIKKTRPIVGHIRHQISKWIDREQSLLFLPKVSSYNAIISLEEDSHIYSCKIEVEIGSKRWFGIDTAKTLQEAIDRALHHMHADPLIRLPRYQINRLNEEVA